MAESPRELWEILSMTPSTQRDHEGIRKLDEQAETVGQPGARTPKPDRTVPGAGRDGHFVSTWAVRDGGLQTPVYQAEKEAGPPALKRQADFVGAPGKPADDYGREGLL
jgi:hypothetical protein